MIESIAYQILCCDSHIFRKITRVTLRWTTAIQIRWFKFINNVQKTL